MTKYDTVIVIYIHKKLRKVTENIIVLEIKWGESKKKKKGLYCIALVCAFVEFITFSTSGTSDGHQRAPRARFPLWRFISSLRSEPERVLGSLSFGFVPVARRQALFRVVVLRVYPNVQHLGVRARLSESERKTQTESNIRSCSEL